MGGGFAGKATNRMGGAFWEGREYRIEDVPKLEIKASRKVARQKPYPRESIVDRPVIDTKKGEKMPREMTRPTLRGRQPESNR